MNYRGMFRVVTAATLVVAVAASLWFTSPVRALKIEFPSQSSSGTLGSTYSFQIKVSIEDQELLPIQSIDLRIYKADNQTYSDNYTGLPLASVDYTSYNGTASTASIKATADNNTWGYSYGYGYAYWQNQDYTFFQPSGYGYGYGYQGGTGTTSITYDINWTVPSGWPAADDYEAEAKITADGSNTFTQTSNTFTLSTAAAPPGPGGGGGGGAPAGVTYVSDYVTSQGRFTREVTAESEDGNVVLTISEDTVGLDDDRPLSRIKIKEMSTKPDPPADAEAIGLTYDITPDGAIFEPPITITITYDPSDIPEGVSEENLVVTWWDEDAEEWIVLEGCVVDPVTHTISAPLSHFTGFSVMAYTRPAAFITSGLSISPTEVGIGQTVNISVLVTNSGDLTGNYNVSLTVDNVVVSTKSVTLNGGATEKVTFTTSGDDAGSYSIDISGLSGTFVVKAAPPTSPPPTTPVSPAPETPVEPTDETPDASPEPINWMPTILTGVLAAVIIIGVIIWLLIRRRQSF